MAEVAWMVRDHLKELLTSNLKDEITDQMEKVWGRYVDRLVSGQATAMGRMQKEFDDAERAEKESQKLLDRALFALSFIGGMALSWVSAEIQYNIWPKYFPRTSIKEYSGFWVSNVKDPKIAAKIFGDTTKEILKLGGELGIDKIVPKSSSPPNVNGIGNLASLQSFKLKLNGEISDQQLQVEKVCREIKNVVEADERFGIKILELAFKKNPSLRHIRDPYDQAHKVNEMMNGMVNERRGQWAKDWFFYGNKPPTISDYGIARKIEQEMWALWLIENRNVILNLTMEDKMRDGSWFNHIIRYLDAEFDFPTDKIRAADTGPQVDEAIEYLLLTWLPKRKPQPLTLKDGILRDIASIPIETYTSPS